MTAAFVIYSNKLVTTSHNSEARIATKIHPRQTNLKALKHVSLHLFQEFTRDRFSNVLVKSSVFEICCF